MNKIPIKKLVDLSRYFGCDINFIIGGGGNTSYKNEEVMYVKASGSYMATINEDGFVVLDRKKLKQIMEKKYPSSPDLREKKVKENLLDSRIDTQTSKRPSVESNFHETIDYPWVFHLHPWIVNTLTCSKQGKKFTKEIFGTEVLWIDYNDPGYTLAKKIYEEKEKYRKKHKISPQVIFLQNHGIIIGGKNPSEVKEKTKEIVGVIKKYLLKKLPVHPANRKVKDSKKSNLVALWIRKALGEKKRRVIYYLDVKGLEGLEFSKIKALTPDQIVYCSPQIISIEGGRNPDKIKEKISTSISAYIKRKGYEPKIVVIEDLGIFGIGENSSSARNCAHTFWDAARIVKISEFFGGPHFIDKKQTNFIDAWEVETYRRKLEERK